VLATVQREGIERSGKQWPAEEEAAFRSKIEERYAHEGSAFFSSARLWDDGVIEPSSSRNVLGLALGAIAHSGAPPQPNWGVFRM